MEPTVLILRNSKARLIRLLLLCSIFVAGGIWIIASDHSTKAQMIGWANIGFFGLGIGLAIWQLTNNNPRITITEHGIEDHTLKVGVIEWQDIVAANVFKIHGTAFIGLELENEAKYLSRYPGWSKNVANANDALGFNRFNINLSSISMNPDKLAELIITNASAARDDLGH
jgi:hypothetical protein